jgi:hypothetical protein
MGALAISVSACGGGYGNSLPFGGPPNNAGGNGGTVQTGSNGMALLRFIQGSPDASPATANAVDVCIDNLPLGITAPVVQYGQKSVGYAVGGGIGHIVSVYPSLGPSNAAGPSGSECGTAPGPFFGTKAIAVTTVSPGVNVRQTIVLGGTNAAGTLGLFVFTEPSFAIVPGSPEAISHNAAPTFSGGKPIGFGTCSTTVTPCVTAATLAGANSLPAPKPSSATAATSNSSVTSPLSAVPAGFYDGAGVPAGTPVPITSIAAPSAAGQPFVVQLYAIDAPAGGLNLIGYVEQTLGYGF